MDAPHGAALARAGSARAKLRPKTGATGLTPRQGELLALLRSRDTTPSFDEIRLALGLKSKSGVARLIDKLEERGHVARTPGRAHSVRLTVAHPELAAVPTPDLLKEIRRRGYDVARRV